jgi:hypothetical protein
MKKLSIMLAFLLALISSVFSQATPANAQQETGGNIIMNEDDLNWVNGPPSLPAGAKLAVLAGDPSKAGVFTLRLKFPANYKIPAHSHSSTENVAVLHGTIYVGSGEKLNEAVATTVSTGGFCSLPGKSPHYAFTKEETIIQVHGNGPFTVTYVNSADDPKNVEAKKQ